MARMDTKGLIQDQGMEWHQNSARTNAKLRWWKAHKPLESWCLCRLVIESTGLI